MSWVELRVHGVSGTPPESLLAVPHVQHVAGDEYSRFFRPNNSDGTEQRDPVDGHSVEAYHWGRFTSGTWRQGLALLLLPFGLVNAAQFMLPRPVTAWGATMHLVAGACLRALGVLLTCLISFTLGLILIDLVGWRWALESPSLANVPDSVVLMVATSLSALGVTGLAALGWSGRTRRPPTTDDDSDLPPQSALDPAFFAGDPNSSTMRLLHLAAGWGTIALLAALTRQTQDGAVDWWTTPAVWLVVAVTLVVVVLGDPERTITVGFNLPKMARGTATARRIKAVSWWLAVALGGAAALLLALETVRLTVVTAESGVASRAVALTDFDAVADVLMVAGIALLAVLHPVNLFHVWRGPGFAHWTRRDAVVRLVMAMPAVGTAVLVLLLSTPSWVVTTAQAVLVVSLMLAVVAGARVIRPGCVGQRADDHYFRPYAGGMTAFLVATLSVFIAVGMSAAVANAAVRTLPSADDKAPDNASATGMASTTEMLDRVSYAWGLTILVSLAVVLATLVWGAARARAYGRVVDREFGPRSDGEPTRLPDGWRDRVARAMVVAQLKNYVPCFVITFVTTGLLVVGVQVYERFAAPDGTAEIWLLDRLSQPRGAPWSGFLAGLGSWTLVFAGGALVAVSRGAIKDSRARRGINVVWDVFSFWPHAVHPFVPRPYSRWTVIELRNRIRYHLDGSRDGTPAAAPVGTRDERKVVLAGHSQGSLICYAALIMLTPAERRRVAFLSCGSQLRVIYPRAFPAYVNLPTHRWLWRQLDGAWVNLYRLTDPLAGPVLSWSHDTRSSRHFGADGEPSEGPHPDDAREPDEMPLLRKRIRRCGNDWRLVDPVPYDEHVQTGPVEALHGHSDFWWDPAWRDALVALRGIPAREEAPVVRAASRSAATAGPPPVGVPAQGGRQSVPGAPAG